MIDIALLKLFHILLFVYWLGGDLGTYYASLYIVKDGLSKEQRSTALTIMMGVDQVPRVCMALILAPGIQLAVSMGLFNIPEWSVVLVWMICLGWLAMVLAMHFGHGKAFTKPLATFDFVFRLVVIASCSSIALYSLLAEGWIIADYLAWKLLMFAVLVACGLGIRVMLKPFIPEFGLMMRNGISEAGDQKMRASLARVRVFVYLIWAGLIINAALGLRLIGV